MARRLATPVSAKLAGDVVGRLLQFGLFIVAARTLTPVDFGRYAFALAAGSVLGALADAGLQLTLLRKLATTTDSGAAGSALGTALVARTLVALPLAVIGVVLSLSIDAPGATRVAVLAIVLGQLVVSFSDLFAQVLRAAGRLGVEAGITLAARTALVVGGTVALLAGTGITGLAAVSVIVAVGWPLAMAGAARWHVRPRRPESARAVAGALRISFPVGVAIALSLLMFRVDVLLLERLRGTDVVGLYSTAYRLFEASLLVPVAVMAAVFPTLARSVGDTARFRAAWQRWGLVLGGTGGGLAVMGWIAGPAVVRLAFGEAYVTAGPLLQVLVLAIPPMFANAVLSQALVAQGRPWPGSVAFAVGLGVNVAVNLALIPSLGATGAAWATVAAEAALFAALLVAIRRPGRATQSASPPQGLPTT